MLKTILFLFFMSVIGLATALYLHFTLQSEIPPIIHAQHASPS